jgi:predicted glycogen debranching enzyme
MKIELNINDSYSFENACSKEWLETNGLGGWASSTVCGTNTRNYHGLFVSAIEPPAVRMVLLSRLDETIIVDNNKYELGCSQFPNKVCLSGLSYLKNFTKDIFPSFHYKIDGIEIAKTIAAVHEEDKVIITYEVLNAEKEFNLELKPFIAYRDYHSLNKKNDSINRSAVFYNGLLKLEPYLELPSLFIHADNSSFTFNPDWYLNFEYKQEQDRGLPFQEDLFSHGNFTVKMSKGSKVGVLISTSDFSSEDAFQIMQREILRRNELINRLPVKDEFTKILALATDQFLVKRGEQLRTIIAGYHWFSDWGRDTMISLPGICLVNGRFEEAKKILKTFAMNVSKGMIPNRFPDNGKEPEYNTVDASLWFFIAIKKYLDYSNDLDFVLKDLLTCLKEIISSHINGTRYNIIIDKDHLLSAGEHGVQLTWMDAKIDNWVVTPRIGKAVEINALWYNALLIISDLVEKNNETEESIKYRVLANNLKKSFLENFLCPERGYLFDYINGNDSDISFRPNQIFAISLPYPLLDKEISASILKMIEEKLLTPFGLRTLAADDPKYISKYRGNQFSRDAAYHQGTVWSWLLGPYITAKVKLEGEAGKKAARELLKKFESHFRDACIGNVSEIFEGEAPFLPKGCIAQAWGAAEILRTYIEDVHDHSSHS